MIKVKARAKLNVSLNITGKRDGLHTLDSVIVPIGIWDDVLLTPRDDSRVTVRYRGKEGVYANDTALAAAEAIVGFYGTKGADIEIVKRIPERAGLGGSSADAAAVARGMETLRNFGKTDGKLLSSLGSDVTAMYLDCPCRISGTGDEAVKLERVLIPSFAVMTAGRGVDTAECYRLYDETGGDGGDTDAVIDAMEKGRPFRPFNSLAKAAASIEPLVDCGLKALSDAGFAAGMTGSGSAVFGFDYDRRSFERKLGKLRRLADGRFEILTF